jgi:hypothetical protein
MLERMNYKLDMLLGFSCFFMGVIVVAVLDELRTLRSRNEKKP